MNSPLLKLIVSNNNYELAVFYLRSLSRDDLFDNLLYSRLGVVGQYECWIDNILGRLKQACEDGCFDNLPKLNPH